MTPSPEVSPSPVQPAAENALQGLLAGIALLKGDGQEHNMDEFGLTGSLRLSEDQELSSPVTLPLDTEFQMWYEFDLTQEEANSIDPAARYYLTLPENLKWTARRKASR